MKLYGFILQGDNPVNWETDNMGPFNKRPMKGYNNKAIRDEDAKTECIKQGGAAVLLFEVTGVIELSKPQFSEKDFTKDGELLPKGV